MKIKSIKLDDVDNNSRAITINTSEKNIETPNRSIATSEINKFKGMRLKSDEPPSPFDVVEETFPWQIYQVPLEYGVKVRTNLGRVNGLKTKINAVKSNVNIPNKMLEKHESENILKILYPKVNRKDKIDEVFMTSLMELECKAGLDIITVPEPSPGCSYEDFISNLKLVTSFLDDFGCTKPIMPMIDIKSNKSSFDKKINYLVDQHLNYNKDFNLLGVSCRVYGDEVNLHTLRSMSDKFEKFWIHGFGAYRNQPNKTFYNPHAATIWGIDTIGVTPQGKYIPGVTDQNNNSNAPNFKLRMYTEDSWGIYKGSKKFVEEHLCDCDGCNYFKKTSDVTKLQNSLDVHELIQSHNQIVSSRQNIQEEDYLSLIKEKSDLKNYYADYIEDIK